MHCFRNLSQNFFHRRPVTEEEFCVWVYYLSLFFSGKSAEVYLKPELVGFGCQLVDEIQDVQPPVSFYVYQCIIKCWETGERIVSNSVKLPVSTYTLPDKSLPEFKIALLICQEEYDYQVRTIFGLWVLKQLLQVNNFDSFESLRFRYFFNTIAKLPNLE